MGSRFWVWLTGTTLFVLLLFAGAGLLIAKFAHKPLPEQFVTSYFEFDLAPGWWCERDGTEFVCYPERAEKHTAIAVIAMKERNKVDTLEAYEDHLRKPQKAVSKDLPEGSLSEIRYVKRRMLGAHEWVEALHAGSEIRDYLTYYLGTTTSHLGILVTMSVHKDKAGDSVRDLNQMMTSLSVHQK